MLYVLGPTLPLLTLLYIYPLLTTTSDRAGPGNGGDRQAFQFGVAESGVYQPWVIINIDYQVSST